MRFITSHIANPINDELEIQVVDDPGAGGANHHYIIHGRGGRGMAYTPIAFQNGTLKDRGVNGVTNESLLAIVMDRLEGFQKGQFACAENATALAAVKTALDTLKLRTQHRIARGVEGTLQK